MEAFDKIIESLSQAVEGARDKIDDPQTTDLIRKLPDSINSNEEYDRIEEIFDLLWNKYENRSPEEDALFDLLANIMEDYESRTLEPIPPMKPVELLKYMMKEHNLKQKDLANIFGSRTVVSNVLSGKSKINKTHAKRLSERFSMLPDAFL